MSMASISLVYKDRGGSWWTDSLHARLAPRGARGAESRLDRLGLRLLRRTP